MPKLGFQDHSSSSENDKNDSASQPSSQSDAGRQGLGALGPSSAGHAAVKVGVGQRWGEGAELSDLGVVTWGASTHPCAGSGPREHRQSGEGRGALRVHGPRAGSLCQHSSGLPCRGETCEPSVVWGHSSASWS